MLFQDALPKNSAQIRNSVACDPQCRLCRLTEPVVLMKPLQERRTKNPRVAIAKAVKQKKPGAAHDAAIIDFWVQFATVIRGC